MEYYYYIDECVNYKSYIKDYGYMETHIKLTKNHRSVETAIKELKKNIKGEATVKEVVIDDARDDEETYEGICGFVNLTHDRTCGIYRKLYKLPDVVD